MHLDEQRALCPAMQLQDMVKFIFQGVLDVGHLFSSREKVRNSILKEMENVPPDASELLCETLSTSWIRTLVDLDAQSCYNSHIKQYGGQL